MLNLVLILHNCANCSKLRRKTNLSRDQATPKHFLIETVYSLGFPILGLDQFDEPTNPMKILFFLNMSFVKMSNFTYDKRTSFICKQLQKFFM